MRQKLFVYLVLAGLAAGFSGQCLAAASLPPDIVRSLYIRLFVQAVRWPEHADIKARPNVNICILGDMDEINAKSYNNQTDNPPLKVVDANGKGMKFIQATCQVVYIAQSEEDKVDGLLEQLKGQPILTVGSATRFVKRGGMFGLLPVGDNIRFAVNAGAIEEGGLKIVQVDALALAVEDKR